ncbi:tripartite tricarboxylate transporter substrate binding protein [Ramlibacter sp. AW1]|uniref:Tripartite tricarboxylate transporter substrate binding protein n=1 Tax=Ramlibacter aurantiacus TaxID=2801330 RepID=A0A936ZUS8_9BURK|nr:tripartite tricarboxylate transporter substrate binding protein [Ramlibacter aurantiacus]MBL0422966.1 tripartite tricarboxylate transporter substrate binding protein [Ramlibacter aurantiacus]
MAHATRSTTRRWFAGAALALLGASAWAQAPGNYPSRPIRFVVNFPAGGPLDIIARQVANKLEGEWKQPVTVENATGAAGAIGANKVAQAEPDGYTVLLSIDAPFTSSAALSPKTAPNWDSFKPVGQLGVTGLTLAVHPSLGVNSLAELVARGKQQPVTFSTAGIGSPGHFMSLMIGEATGMKVTPVHYRGNAPAVLALVSGEVQAGALASTGLLPHLKDHKIKGLGVVSGQRSALLPELKTMGELGYPKLQLESRFVAFVPARTPDAIVSQLYKGISDAMNAPGAQERWKSLDIVPTTQAGPEMAATLQAARSQFEATVKSAGLKPEQ